MNISLNKENITDEDVVKYLDSVQNGAGLLKSRLEGPKEEVQNNIQILESQIKERQEIIKKLSENIELSDVERKSLKTDLENMKMTLESLGEVTSGIDKYIKFKNL